MRNTELSDNPEPEPGDLIEISREGYKHWAVYVGGKDRAVVHLTVPDGIFSVSVSSTAANNTKMGVVKKELLSVVVAGDEYHVNRKYDQKYKPRPVEEILRDAKAKVGKQMPYNLLTNNCEHFAMELRYGVHKSKQVEAGLTIGGVTGVVIAGLLGIVVIAFNILKTR